MFFTSGMMLNSSLVKCFVFVTLLCNLDTGHAYPRRQYSSISSSPTAVKNREERSSGTDEYYPDAEIYTLKTQVEICDVFCFNGSKHYLPLRCRGPRIVTCSHCSCDDACAIYGDCCPDKDGVVPPSNSRMNFSCVGGHGLAFTTGTPYLMIDTCPDDSALPKNLGPVTSTLTNITYVNQAAAVCNKDLEFVSWEPGLHCGSWGYCDNQFKPTPEDVYHHPCNWQRTKVDQTVIGICNVSGSVPAYAQGLDELCRSNQYPVYHGITAYTNVFCYLCNVVDGVTFTSDCSDGWDTFLGKTEHNLNCSVDTWADHYSGTCREIHCMSGLVLRNGTCVIDPVRPYSLFILMLTFDLSKVPGLETWEEVVQLFRDGVQRNIVVFRPFAYYFAVESLESSTSKEVHLSVELWSRKDNKTISLTDIFYGVWRKWRFLHRGRVLYLHPKPYDFYKTGIETREFMFDPVNNTCCLETDYDTFFDYLYAETDIFDGRDEIHNEFDFNGPPCPYVIPTDEEIELFDNGSIRIMADSVTLGRGDYFRLYENEVQICISTLQAAQDRTTINSGDNSWNSADKSVKETSTDAAEFKETLNENVNETFTNTDPEYSIENKNGNVNKTSNLGTQGYRNVNGTDISNNENLNNTTETVNFTVGTISNVTDTEYSNEIRNSNVSMTSNNRDLRSPKQNFNGNYTLINENPDYSSENVHFNISKTSNNTNPGYSNENENVKVNNTLNDTEAGYSKETVNNNVRMTSKNTDSEYSKENVNFNVSKTSHINSNKYGENMNFHIGLTSHSTDNKYSSQNENVKINKTLNNTDIEYSNVNFNTSKTSNKLDNKYSSKNRNINNSNTTDIENHKTNISINVDTISNTTYAKFSKDNVNSAWSSNNTDSEYSHKENWNFTNALNENIINSSSISVNTNDNITLGNTGQITNGNVTLNVNITLNGQGSNIENVDGLSNVNMTMNTTTIHSDFNIGDNENITLKNDDSLNNENDIGNLNKTLNNGDYNISSKNLRENHELTLNITEDPHINLFNSSINNTEIQYYDENDNMALNNTKLEPNGSLTLHINSTLNRNDTQDASDKLDDVSNITITGTSVDPIDNLHGNDNLTLYITDTEDSPSGRAHNNTEISTQHSYYVNLTKYDKNVTTNRTGNMDTEVTDAEVESGSVGHSFRALVFTIGTCLVTLHVSCLY